MTKKYRNWTELELNFVKAYYGKIKTEEIQTRFLPNRTIRAITHKAFNLKLKYNFGLFNKGDKNPSKRLEVKRKISISHLGNKNPNWKGDKVGYQSLHIWVTRYKPKPILCEKCEKKEPYDIANISGKYKREISDFKWLCRSCHMKEDGRLKELLKNRVVYGRDKEGKFISKDYVKNSDTGEIEE
jgi:hypothetical protein